MNTPDIETQNLAIIPKSIAEVRAMIASMTNDERAELSTDWLAHLRRMTAPDSWILGFTLVQRESGAAIGHAGFKGPPDKEGMVEIAYGVAPEFQGSGYATEAARALLEYAFRDDRVRVVRAHTLPEPNASTRVLTKCGFLRLGEVIDPEDGPVWRWQKYREVCGSK